MDAVKSVKSLFTKKDFAKRPLPDIPQATNKGTTSTSDSGVVNSKKPDKQKRSMSLGDNQTSGVSQLISTKVPQPPHTAIKKSVTLPKNVGECSPANLNDSSAGEFTIACPCGGIFKCSPSANDGNNCTIKCACGRVFGYSSQLPSPEQCPSTYDKQFFLTSKPSKPPNESKDIKPSPPPILLPKALELKTPTKHFCSQPSEGRNKPFAPNPSDKKDILQPPKTPLKPFVSTSPATDNNNQIRQQGEMGGFKMTRTKDPGSYLVAKNVETNKVNVPPILEKSLQLKKGDEPGSYALVNSPPPKKQFDDRNGALKLELETSKDNKTGYYQVKKPNPQDTQESQHSKKSPPPPPPTKISNAGLKAKAY